MSPGARRKKAEALTVDWIEVSARTLDDATELALDRLGVVADELEYEVIDEPRGGLFGIGRTEARIRARVKPLSREKPTDRRRRRSSERRPSGGRKPRRRRGHAGVAAATASRPAAGSDDADELGPAVGDAAVDVARPDAPARPAAGRGAGGGATGASPGPASEKPARQRRDERPEAKVNVDTDMEDVDVEAQAEQAGEFTAEPGRGHGPHRHGQLPGRRRHGAGRGRR